ncbi:MAG: hypothetical protein WCR08_11505 [Gammaproteobacteria bacterium]
MTIQKKMALLIAFVAFSIVSFAQTQENSDEQARMKMLADLGLPLPGSGIKLVPRSKLNLSKEQLALGKKAEEEMNTLGYAIDNSDRPKELLNMRHEAKSHFRIQSAKAMSDTNTGLRPKVENLKLAFKFKGVSQSKDQHTPKMALENKIILIGAAPQGGFHENKGGWSGAVQFFEMKNIGTCSYGLMNVKASNTAAELAIEDVTYLVNKKATITTVYGSPSTGFIYKVEWYDNENFHELECANMTYSPNLKQEVINLAKNIDKA